MSNKLLFDREFYQNLREDAEKAKETVDHPHWKLAYQELAVAADRLDAMIARTVCTHIDAPSDQS